MKLTFNQNQIAFHVQLKKNDDTYPSLPKRLQGMNQNTIDSLDEASVRHINSLLMGFNSRVHNWQNAKEKSILTPKQDVIREQEIVATTVEEFWND